MGTLKKIPGHAEVLTKEAKEVIIKIALFVPPHFYMAGGTALALQLGHRISIDFDFFTEASFDDLSRGQLLAQLGKSGTLEQIEKKEGTLHVLLNQVHLSFFNYPYRLLFPPLLWQSVRLAQLEDIAPMKLNAILGRGSKKDFIDLFMIAKKIGLKKVFDLSLKKFPKQPSFHLQAARALVFFQDAEREPMPKMLCDLSWPEIKNYFQSETKKVVKDMLEK
ncbi:MAG: nucleotidyl transferase AbiEii/AbiGii toxin family protein [Deltaproteobacteria bacterium]